MLYVHVRYTRTVPPTALERKRERKREEREKEKNKLSAGANETSPCTLIGSREPYSVLLHVILSGDVPDAPYTRPKLSCKCIFFNTACRRSRTSAEALRRRKAIFPIIDRNLLHHLVLLLHCQRDTSFWEQETSAVTAWHLIQELIE